MSINNITFFTDIYGQDATLILDKPLICLVWTYDFNDWSDFLNDLEPDQDYITIIEWIPDINKYDENHIWLGEPFFISRKSNPWLIYNHIKNEINQAKLDFEINEDQDNNTNFCLIRFNKINI
jgi:hypothetical protein